MTVFFYDGSFEGMLCAAGQALRQRPGESTVRRQESLQISCLEQKIQVPTDEAYASRFYQRTRLKFGLSSLQSLYLGFLHPDSDDFLLLAYRQMIAYQQPLSKLLGHPNLVGLSQQIQSVKRELHRFKGFLRFEELSPKLFYAPYEPAYDLTFLLMGHFTQRLPHQSMILHDQRRALACLYDQSQIRFISGLQIPSIQVNAKEQEVQALWQSYFSSLSIEGRKNLALQQNRLPKKYWKHLPEMRLSL